jgi:pimeloyl-CoA synthetase
VLKMANDVLEFRIEAVEEDVRDLKSLTVKIVEAQSRTDSRLAGLEGQLKIQNDVLQNGFKLIQKVIMAGIGIISLILTGTQVMV